MKIKKELYIYIFIYFTDSFLNCNKVYSSRSLKVILMNSIDKDNKIECDIFPVF